MLILFTLRKKTDIVSGRFSFSSDETDRMLCSSLENRKMAGPLIKQKILIVDDAPANISLLGRCLGGRYEIIIEGRGEHFDPELVDAFIKIQDTFREIAREFIDNDADA
jgi:hypothetical protein